MRGTSKVRLQGYQDPLLVSVMQAHGMTELPLFKHRPAHIMDRLRYWNELGKDRSGTPAPEKTDPGDPAELSARLKAMALKLGADAVGICRLTPIMIDSDVDLPHDYAICMLMAEDYGEALKGPRAVEEESTSVYVRCADASTALAKHIRDMGWDATAHHNGGCDIQAIPAMHAAGLGELGEHGSLIHPEYGASHRPGIVTTTLPLVPDAPIVFGVQDTCLTCNLCSNNCPAEAIPSTDYVMTEGVHRWITDVEKCYTVSRLRAQYCHICVDACPYIHKANGDPVRKAQYKDYMRKRKQAGYRTPAWFPEEEDEILGAGAKSA